MRTPMDIIIYWIYSYQSVSVRMRAYLCHHIDFIFAVLYCSNHDARDFIFFYRFAVVELGMAAPMTVVAGIIACHGRDANGMEPNSSQRKRKRGQ